VKLSLGGILRTLGKVGKGFATIAGSVLGVGGLGAAVVGGNDQLAACVTTLLSQPEGASTMIGVLLLAFGIGRKAGWIAAPPTKSKR